jgi:hypothetical protein
MGYEDTPTAMDGVEYKDSNKIVTEVETNHVLGQGGPALAADIWGFAL